MPPVKAKLGDRGNKRILMEVEINSGKENYACPFSHHWGPEHSKHRSRNLYLAGEGHVTLFGEEKRRRARVEAARAREH